MKRLFFATTAFVVLAAASAGAADMSVSPVYAPPPVPVYSWTGIYFGGNVGYSWGQSKSDRTGSLVGLGVNVRESQEVDGVIGRPNRLQLSVWNMGVRVGNRHPGLRSEGRLDVSSLGTSS
jgi:opacity protein-like surface antigen